MIDRDAATDFPYCAPLLDELATLRQQYEHIARQARVDTALARQLSRSMTENARLCARLAELGVKDP